MSPPIWRVCFGLAWPLVLSNQIVVWSEAVLMFWLGRMLGGHGIAIYTLTLPVYYFVGCAFMAISIGASPQIAWSIGARDGRGLSIAVSALVLALLASVAVAILTLLLSAPLARSLSSDPVIVHDVHAMLVAMLLVMLPLMTFAEILVDAANAAVWTRVTMGRSLLELAVMAGMAPLLIGPLGLGVAGAPVASGIAGGLLAVLIWTFMRRSGGTELGTEVRRAEVFKWATWRRIIDIGLPVQGSRIAHFAVHTLLLRRAAASGEDGVAGFGLAWLVVGFGFATTAAVAQAGAILAGQSLGARHLARARAALSTALAIAVATGGAVMFVVLSLAPGPLLRIFTSDPKVIQAGIDAMGVLRWTLFPVAVFEVLLAGFTAFGVTKRAGALGLLSEVAGLVFAYVWTGAGSAAEIVAVAVCISITLRAAFYLVLARYIFVRLPLESAQQ